MFFKHPTLTLKQSNQNSRQPSRYFKILKNPPQTALPELSSPVMPSVTPFVPNVPREPGLQVELTSVPPVLMGILLRG